MTQFIESSRTGRAHLCLKISKSVLPLGRKGSAGSGTAELPEVLEMPCFWLVYYWIYVFIKLIKLCT